MIELITTGGTIDKTYDPQSGQLIFNQSYIENMMAQGRYLAAFTVHPLFQKDSLDISDVDRQLILETVEQSKHTKIIITHGTDTMVETATLIGKKITDKTIILFGAMIPFSVNESDALFNFGSSVIAVQTLSPGCYIVMNGQVFHWDDVTKNKDAVRFESTR